MNTFVALDGFDNFRDNFKYHKTQNRKKIIIIFQYSFFSWEEKVEVITCSTLTFYFNS